MFPWPYICSTLCPQGNMLPGLYSSTLQYSIWIFEFPKSYVPKAPYFKCSMFPKPYIPRVLCSQGQMFPKPYSPKAPYSQGLVFPMSYYFHGQGPIFQILCVLKVLYSHFQCYMSQEVHVPRLYVPTGICSQGLIVQWFYISRDLNFPWPYRVPYSQGYTLPGPYSPTVPYSQEFEILSLCISTTDHFRNNLN